MYYSTRNIDCFQIAKFWRGFIFVCLSNSGMEISQHRNFAALETSLYGNGKGNNNSNSSNAATATKAFLGRYIRKSKSKLKTKPSLAQVFPDYNDML